MKPVRWGVLGAGGIAGTVVAATRACAGARFTAVGSRDAERSRAFADSHGVDHAYGSYADLLASSVVDAVYVALPVALHAEWTVAALRAGKHVLCEKPFATTAADAERAYAAADAAGVRVVEGFMYRFHPQTALLRRLVADGAVGELAYVRAELTVSVQPDDIRRMRAVGGGALYDLGCYCASAVRLLAGEPETVYASAVWQDDGADRRLAATLRMPDRVLAQFDIGLDLPRRDRLDVVGTAGRIVVADPWLCRTGTIELRSDGAAGVEHVPVDPDGGAGLTGEEADLFRLEFDAVSAAIAAGTPLEFERADAVAQARTLEAIDRSARSGDPVAVETR